MYGVAAAAYEGSNSGAQAKHNNDIGGVKRRSAHHRKKGYGVMAAASAA